MNALPLALFWMLALWGTASRRPVLLYLFFATMPFGAMAAIPTTLTGGLTLTPTPIVALLLIARTFADRRGVAEFVTLAVLPQRLMLLSLFWLVAAVTTAFMPRLFAGEVMVVPVRGVVDAPQPLHPTAQNLSQFIYMTIAVLSAFAFARLLRTPGMQQHAFSAIGLGGLVTAVTGLLDQASEFLPLAPLLAPFRTATYALLTEVEVFGGKRVVGFMPEASAYGGLCLAFLSALYFYRRAMDDPRLRDVLVPLVLILLVLCAWLSKSSGTYVGLGILLAMAALEWSLRIGARAQGGNPQRRGLRAEMATTACLVITVALIALLRPQWLDPVHALVERMVLEKQESSSFVERGMWRAAATAALAQTHGLGVGLGATRASSSVVAVFSGTGLIGGLLLHAFILQSLMRRPPHARSGEVMALAAFRYSFVAPFLVSLMVGDADFGGITAFGLGLATAIGADGRRSRQVDRHCLKAPELHASG
jgi:hypothetical protein